MVDLFESLVNLLGIIVVIGCIILVCTVIVGLILVAFGVIDNPLRSDVVCPGDP